MLAGVISGASACAEANSDADVMQTRSSCLA
jgi:hypothetical protein